MAEAEKQALLKGTWESVFPFEISSWNDANYDLFELPRGMRITRSEVLGFYSDASRAELDRIRVGAMERQTRFDLELEITTALGNTRWLRMITEVEYRNGVPHRVYGTNEDITAERPSS